MPGPEELEAAADRLRDCTTEGRTKAQALALIDSLEATGDDARCGEATAPRPRSRETGPVDTRTPRSTVPFDLAGRACVIDSIVSGDRGSVVPVGP